MNLRWSILHFFIYIVQICWNLDTHCASFVYGMHRLSYQPALSIHFPFSIFHSAQRKIPLVSERDFPLPAWRIITSCPFAVRDTLSCRVIDGVPHARQHKEQAIRIAHRIAEQRADTLPGGEVSGGQTGIRQHRREGAHDDLHPEHRIPKPHLPVHSTSSFSKSLMRWLATRTRSSSSAPCCLIRVIKCAGTFFFSPNTTASPQNAPTFVPPI